MANRLYGRARRGEAPYGFEHWDPDFRPVRAEQKALARMRELRVAGLSYGDIAERLTREGFRIRRGGAFSRQSVYQHLRKPPA